MPIVHPSTSPGIIERVELQAASPFAVSDRRRHQGSHPLPVPLVEHVVGGAMELDIDVIGLASSGRQLRPTVAARLRRSLRAAPAAARLLGERGSPSRVGRRARGPHGARHRPSAGGGPFSLEGHHLAPLPRPLRCRQAEEHEFPTTGSSLVGRVRSARAGRRDGFDAKTAARVDALRGLVSAFAGRRDAMDGVVPLYAPITSAKASASAATAIWTPHSSWLTSLTCWPSPGFAPTTGRGARLGHKTRISGQPQRTIRK